MMKVQSNPKERHEGFFIPVGLFFNKKNGEIMIIPKKPKVRANGVIVQENVSSNFYSFYLLFPHGGKERSYISVSSASCENGSPY